MRVRNKAFYLTWRDRDTVVTIRDVTRLAFNGKDASLALLLNHQRFDSLTFFSFLVSFFSHSSTF